jgi:ssDNA-binding Zn-finger/Zn-ribbon topoisomerase 1
MYELMSLKLKCIYCGTSLMDHEQPVDHEPSIKLSIECLGKYGTIWLSSIYGSYNYKATIDIPKDEIAEFYCPHCSEQITSTTECLSCGASMVPFYLDMGGKVSICSRSGCKNHFVEFDDLSLALKKLYQEYGYDGRGPAHVHREKIVVEVEDEKDEAAEIIRTGTFLQAYCPYCKKTMIEDDMLKVKITNGEEGLLMLSPYLNVFSSKSTIFLPEDKVVTDLKCIHCDHSLLVDEKVCGFCGSPVARIAIGAQTKLIDFYVCTKKGCKWHGLDQEDLDDIRLEDSLEW